MRNLRSLAVGTAIAVAFILSAGPAFAEQVAWNGTWVDAAVAAAQPEARGGTHPDGPEPDTYGSSGWIGYAVGPCDGFVRTGSVAVANQNCERIAPAADGDLSVGFPIHLPNGASMQYLRIYYYGNSTTVHISAGLYRSKDGSTTLVSAASPTATAAGNAFEQFGPFSETVDNSPTNGATYHFVALAGKSGAAVTGIYKVYIYYKLQTSPAPATATFADVPTSYWAYQYIEALAASGITSGCTSGMFCPNANVTRAEMAVFLADALGLHYQY